MSALQDFYDNLAPYYRLLFQDWEASVRRHASALDSVIREFFGDRARRVLDAACGIGTQSLGLAELGYDVTASDISPGAVELARQEAAGRGLDIRFRIADMRGLPEHFGEPFDVVLACDNAVPHLLSDEGILQAFRSFYECTTPDGGAIISVRDYAAMEREARRFNPRLVHPTDQGQTVLFDVWEFDGDYYDITMYFVTDTGGTTADTRVIRGGRYYMVSITTLEALFRQAGFERVVTLRDRFFQPVIVAAKSRETIKVLFEGVDTCTGNEGQKRLLFETLFPFWGQACYWHELKIAAAPDSGAIPDSCFAR